MPLSLVLAPALEALPGVVHGFERRSPTTPEETHEATRARVASALEGRGRLCLMRQVHGATVVRAPWEEKPDGDVALTTTPGVLVGVETADCLPLLLVDPVRLAAAVVHAGWRGTAARVAAHATAALVASGSRPEDLVAAAGPCIGACCYEVGEELRPAFGRGAELFFQPGPRGRPHLDVRAANVSQLVESGVSPENIHHVHECTSCGGDLYHSYRRDGPGGGRMISFVGYEQEPRTVKG